MSRQPQAYFQTILIYCPYHASSFSFSLKPSCDTNIYYIIYLFHCNWAVTRWQWSVYMYTRFTTKFRSGGLHEKHVVATWHLGYHLSICSWTQGNQEKPVSRWPVAGPSGPCPLDSSPVTIQESHGPHT